MTSLTAGEIEELKELEAKATPGPWFWDMKISMRPFAACADSGYADLPHKKSDGQLISAMRNALPALLSMLQPPVAADVANARSILEHVCAGGGTSMVGVIHTLLADHARLTTENERLRAVHEAELGVCEKHCTVVAAQAERIKRLEAELARRELREAMTQGMIQAIKNIRNATGCHLMEAREAYHKYGGEAPAIAALKEANRG